jgi:hypothetical protein
MLTLAAYVIFDKAKELLSVSFLELVGIYFVKPLSTFFAQKRVD